MARKTRRLLPPAAGRTPVEQFEMEQFARRLDQLIQAKGWSPSDFAREVWGSTTDKRGYSVAKGRDRISVYLKGKSYPDRKNLKLMADALGVKPEYLAPDLAGAPVERENPEIAMTAINGHHDKVLLRVNKLVPLELASQVISLLSAHKPANSTQQQEKTQ